MFQFISDCVYNGCFGVKKRQKDNKIHDAIYATENLSQEEFYKLMRIYNKCC